MERVLELTIKTPETGVENRYQVKWPTIQQMIDIEALKITLSKGKYTQMIVGGTKLMNEALNYIDMCSYLTVMCPQLVSDMKVDIRDLEIGDANKTLLRVYQEQFLPWWNDYYKMIEESQGSREE